MKTSEHCFRRIGLLFLSSTILISCATTRIVVKKDNLSEVKMKFFVKQNDDPRNWYPDIKAKCEANGYTVFDKNSEADFIIEYSYIYYFDLVVYTYNLMNMMIYRPVTTEVIVSSNYAGDAPYGPKRFLYDTFKKF